MRTTVVIALVVAACNFEHGALRGAHDDAGDVRDDAPVMGIDPPWWNGEWQYRRRIAVTAGSVHPDKGYVDYTVRLSGLTLQGVRGDCEDVRVVAWSASTWTELSRDLIGCTDLRFPLPLDIPDSTTWRDAYVYYANPAAPRAPRTGVYRFVDPATTDRSADYQRGRMDPWLSTGYDNSLAWNSAGYYTYDTADNSQSSYRIAVGERDVLVEAEFRHTGCYANNMQTAVCARGIIATGTGGTEDADHYYCTTRAQNPTCNDIDQGIYDGDIVKTDNEIIALQGLTDPPPLVANQWRKQALATFGAGPTQLRFWDADASWPDLGYPPATAIQATGTDAVDYTGRGFAGIMTAQDIGQFRNLVVRRYVEPEPVVVIEGEEVRPATLMP
ncbi:MAG TPA: hypothetical protein VLB44_00565 [Kofleriaceae bacterium]|nr:hypothetical protein [Kofleriaceae bacterium]